MVTIYTTPSCSYCLSAKQLLTRKKIAYREIDVAGNAAERARMVELAGGRRTVPQIFAGNEHIGGCDDLYELEAKGYLDSLLSEHCQGVAAA